MAHPPAKSGGGDPCNKGVVQAYLAGNDPDPSARAAQIASVREMISWAPAADGQQPSSIKVGGKQDQARLLTRWDLIQQLLALVRVGIDMKEDELENKLRDFDEDIRDWFRHVFGNKKGSDEHDDDDDQVNDVAAMPLEQRLIKRYKPMLRGTRPAAFGSDGGPPPTWWSAVPFAGATLNDAAFAYTHMNSGASEFLTLVPATSDGALPLHYGMAEADVAAMLPEGTTLASLLAAKRLFVCDFSQLLAVNCGAEPNPEMVKGGVRAAPIALFWVDEAGALMPLAIRLFPTTAVGAEGDPVFTPAAHGSTPAWSAAKLFVNNAAIAVHTANEHQIASAFAGIIGAALVRNAAEVHPIASAIGPFFNQFWALELQYAAGVSIALDRPWTGVIAAPFAKTFDWHAEYDQKQRLADRGIVALEQCLAGHDMAKMYDIYEDFAASVVAAVYKDDAAVKADAELQAMAKDIVAPDAGNLKGTTPNGTFETRDELARLLTSFIFYLSAGHGRDVADFGWYTWIPTSPICFKLDPPRSNEAAAAVTDDAIMAALADPSSSEAQTQVMGIMAAYQQRSFSRLTTGGGPDTATSVPETPHWLRNYEGFEAVRTRWYTALDGLEKAIDARNRAAAATKAPHGNVVLWPCFQMKPTDACLSLWQ